MTATGARRASNSTRRRQQAAETRALVLSAATTLFADGGWSGTAMRDVARAAGVAVETVYTHFGSKTDLLLAAIDVGVVGDLAPVPMAQRPEFAALGVGSPGERIAATVALVSGINQRSWGLQRALREGAVSDPQLADRLREMEHRHRENVRHGAELVVGGPVDDRIVDTFWALLGIETFHLLTVLGGHTVEDYQEWLRYAITQLLRE